MLPPPSHRFLFLLTPWIFLALSSCFSPPWPNTTVIENTYKKNSALFDTLVGWGFYETHGDQPTSFFADSVPPTQKKYFLQLGIKSMKVQQHFCETYKNGHGAVTFEFNETSHSSSYMYLLFSQDINDESRKYFTQHGRYKQLNNFWYMVQQEVQWAREIKQVYGKVLRM